jgi:hypothetical protein
VTAGAYRRFASLPRGNAGDSYPVANVDWDNTVAFCSGAGRPLVASGEVYRAATPSSGRDVVVKVLSTKLAGDRREFPIGERSDD